MKGIFCGECFSIHSLPSEWLKPTQCDCGNVIGWWIDPVKGIARYYAENRYTAFMIGWNNTYLIGHVEAGTHVSNVAARELHKQSTNAPGFFFDQSNRDCWSVILKPGVSSDTAWATIEELKAMHATIAQDVMLEKLNRHLDQIEEQLKEKPNVEQLPNTHQGW